MVAPAMSRWLSLRAHRKVAVLSTESIAGASPPLQDSASRCASCGATLAADQRYCLECGERRATVSDFLRAGPPRAAAAAPPGSRPPGPSPQAPLPRSNALTLLAGIGVLLLAMGVGVLIGRAGSSSVKSPQRAEVVNVGSGAGAPSTGAEESFTGEWPSGTKGYTVELQTLPTQGTTPAAVTAAKTAASGKGAASVGALKSDEYSSLPAGSYVIYSGVYHKRAEAATALGKLKSRFPGAKVIEVSESASGPAGGSGRGRSGGAGVGSSPQKPAKPSSLGSLTHAKGKKYVEESAKLPNVVETP
jgi:hypothetical protein